MGFLSKTSGSRDSKLRVGPIINCHSRGEENLDPNNFETHFHLFLNKALKESQT